MCQAFVWVSDCISAQSYQDLLSVFPMPGTHGSVHFHSLKESLAEACELLFLALQIKKQISRGIKQLDQKK